MLNILSFFFMRDIKQRSEFYKTGFDAQCSELFLYTNWISKPTVWYMFRCSTFWAFSLSFKSWMLCDECWEWVSMLNVLSFFFISSDNGKCYHLLQEVSMLKVLSFFFIYYKNGKDNLRKFRCSIFWAFSL